MEEEYEEQEGSDGEQSEFKLNMEILEEQTGISTTLGDQYGYSVFSEEFRERAEEYQEQKEEEQEKYIQKIFGQERNNGLEEAFEAVFSAEPRSIVKAEYESSGGEAQSLGFTAGFVLIGMFLTGILLLGLRGIRKGRNAHAADSYNDWAK